MDQAFSVKKVVGLMDIHGFYTTHVEILQREATCPRLYLSFVSTSIIGAISEGERILFRLISNNPLVQNMEY